MKFELLNPTTAKLASVTNRVERHGEEKIPAISFGLKITGPNTLLDALDPSLRATLYKAVEGQEDLPGVEASTPLLRTRSIELFTVAAKFEGWTLVVEHGIDDETALVFTGCKVDKFKVTPFEGGSCEVTFRVSTNDLVEGEAGAMWAQNGQDITFTLTAPVPVVDPIDGTVDAFEREAYADATDLFLAGHGDDN